MTRDECLSLRDQYEPEVIRLVIIAESPPTSGLYFYNPEGCPSEPLFAALMQQLRLSPLTKEGGLRGLQRSGWILVDATYQPVNTLSRSSRDSVIGRDYSLLLRDLRSLIPDQLTPLILIKANICRILGPKLEADGFNVVNRGRPIYFPASGWQKKFRRQFAEVLKSAGICNKDVDGRDKPVHDV
jgi:hypothetical protein